MVYEIQRVTISQYVCVFLPHVNRIEYWSDGCAAQYKNTNNFLNLCLHKADFGLEAEWSYQSC